MTVSMSIGMSIGVRFTNSISNRFIIRIRFSIQIIDIVDVESIWRLSDWFLLLLLLNYWLMIGRWDCLIIINISYLRDKKRRSLCVALFLLLTYNIRLLCIVYNKRLLCNVNKRLLCIVYKRLLCIVVYKKRLLCIVNNKKRLLCIVVYNKRV